MKPINPQCQNLLDAMATPNAPSWEEIGPQQARQEYISLTKLFGTGPSDVAVQDTTINDAIPVRIYTPQLTTEQNLPVVVYFHGGGWVVGNLETHDALCRRISQQAHCAVVSVDYGLAPENPAPKPLQDCYAVTVYVANHADELGLDATRLVVAGDSAGGALAAGVALKARDTAGPKLLAQVLIYPVIDPACNTRSYDQFADGFGLTKVSMQWFWRCYLGNQGAAAHAVDIYSIPAQAPSLTGLPHTILITAGYDVLRDEGELYAKKLQAAGVEVQYQLYEDMMHGFVHFAGVLDVGRTATSDLARQLTALFTKE